MGTIGTEFSGLPMDQLIGGPLRAACDAQVRLAKASADFINTVGFNETKDKDGKVIKVEPKQVDFSYWQPLPLNNEPVVPEIQAKGTISCILKDQKTKTGSIDTITIDNADILGGKVDHTGDNVAAAKQVAKQITEGISGYTASEMGGVVVITAPLGSGANLNKKDITITGTNIIIPKEKPIMDGGRPFKGNTTTEDTHVQKVVLSVPMLALVNIPSLMVKKVDITFDMEVKSSETHVDGTAAEAALDASGKGGWGPFSAEVKIHGSVSTHQENTRSTDRSAKYHVSVQAQDDGMPEGLSRVIDILQKSIAPVSVSQATPLKVANVGQLA